MREHAGAGDQIEVWNAFSGRWTDGFRVDHVVEEDGRPVAVRVARTYDETVLPGAIGLDAVRLRRQPS